MSGAIRNGGCRGRFVATDVRRQPGEQAGHVRNLPTLLSWRSSPKNGCERPIRRDGNFVLTKSKRRLSEVTYVPWGEWFQPTAFRKNIRDVLKFDAPIFWNVKMA
jgi:hypothetical protein